MKSSRPPSGTESEESDLPTESQTGQPQNPTAAPERRIFQVIRETVQRELRVFSGPLPPPEVLAAYEKVFPGCAKSIVEMAQKEQAHRHEQDSGDLTLAKRGQLIGGGLALVAVLGAIYLVAHDKSISGLSVLGAVVVALGGAFVYDRYQRTHSPEAHTDRGEKAQEVRALPESETEAENPSGD